MSSDNIGAKSVNGPNSQQYNEESKELLAENALLKEYISQVNEQMKEQCRTLEKVKTAREVISMQDQYKKIRAVVLKFQERIAEKDIQIRDLEKRLTDAGIVSVHYPSMQPNSGDASEGVYFQRIRELEIKIQELAADNEEKEQQVRQKDLTLRDLQEKLEQAQKAQNDRVLQLTHEYEIKEQALLHQLDTVSGDPQAGMSSQQHSQEIKTLKEQMVALVQDVQMSHTQLNTVTKDKNELMHRCYLLEKQVKVARAETDDLRQKDDMLIDDLRRRLDQLQAQVVERERERSDVEKSLQSMTKRYEQLNRNQLGGITPTTAGLTEKVAEMQEQLDMARVLNMSLESEQLNLQKRAHQAKVDYDHIVQRCQALENENVLLKFQADTYRTDFEAERSEREKTAGTMDTLREQIAELQLRNQQLQDEIKIAMDQSFSSMAAAHQQQQTPYSSYTRPTRSHHPMTFHGDDEADSKSHRLPPSTIETQLGATGGFLPYPCPCGKAFSTVAQLQVHLDNCPQFSAPGYQR